jgi:NhaP-type Na+/H+ or K+/H+ antiporter
MEKGEIMEVLFPMLHFTILLVLGLLFALIADRIRMQYELPLLLLGLALGSLVYAGRPLIEAPLFVVIVIGVSALILLSFDRFSRLRWRETDSLSRLGFQLTITHLILSFCVTFMFAYLIMQAELVMSLILASSLAAVSVGRYSHRSHTVTHLLTFESALSGAVAIVVVSALMGTYGQIETLGSVMSQGSVQIISGLAVGVFMSILVFSLYRNHFIRTLSPILLTVSVIATYTAAELLRGDGIVASAVMGLFFGNFTVQKKRLLGEHTSKLAYSLMILVCILFGVHVHMAMGSWQFFWQASALFLLLLIVRVVSVVIAFFGKNMSRSEYVALMLHAPRGSVSIALLFFVLGILHSTDPVLIVGALVILLSQITEFFMSRTKMGSL